MGAGSKFDSSLSTRGGRLNFINENDIKTDDQLSRDLLAELDKEGIKYSKDKIVFVARLENGNKIFLETRALDHILSRHSSDFEKAFGTKRSEVSSLLENTIRKGRLISSKLKYVNDVVCYSNKYYYKGKYSIVYGIANNGYIETAYPKEYGGE